jgi:probable LLM family oxidoreductase
MELGIYSFADRNIEPSIGETPTVARALKNTLERITLADELGLGFYGVGEHHLEQYASSNPATVLAAASSITRNITLSTAVSVLSTEDPVRLYQQFTTIDQLSEGRAELLAGRGSFVESFPLFGAELRDYDALFDEKLGLLLALDKGNPVTWQGTFRAPLVNADVFPRPYGDHLRMSVATGGNPQSSVRAGALGLPVVYAIIGGQPERFAPLVDLYRRAADASGNADRAHVTMSAIGLIGENARQTADTFYPYWNQVMTYGARARGWSVPSRADYDHYVAGARDLFVGEPGLIAERLVTVGRLTRADRYALQMDWAGVPHATVMKAIELLGTEVKPIVDAELAEPARS